MRNKQLDRMASEGGEVEILVVQRFEMGYGGANVEHEDKETVAEGSEEDVEGKDPWVTCESLSYCYLNL